MAMATATAVPHSFSASGIIQGYHVYQNIWTPHVGKEAGNEHDRFTVAVLEDEMLCTFEHLPQEISEKCFFFHKRQSNWCRGDWSRQKSTQLDMGMEIPCILTFTCEDLHILDKAKELLARKDFKPKDQLKAEGHLVTVNFKSVKPTRAEKKSQTEEPQKKRPRKK